MILSSSEMNFHIPFCFLGFHAVDLRFIEIEKYIQVCIECRHCGREFRMCFWGDKHQEKFIPLSWQFFNHHLMSKKHYDRLG